MRRTSFPVLALSFLVAFGALGCSNPVVSQPEDFTRIATVSVPSAQPEPVPGRPPSARPRVRVLWRGVADNRHASAILGVDPHHRHAYFTRGPVGPGWYFEVVQVPLSAQQPNRPPLSQWTSNHAGREGFAEELQRFAAILEEVGPFMTHTRGGQLGPSIAASKDALLFEADSEVHISDRKGEHIRKFASTRTARNPLLSTDGTAAMFTGCHMVPQVPEKVRICEHHLYIAAPVDSTPVRIQEVVSPEPPVFSADGRYIYAVSRDDGYVEDPEDRGGCLFRVEVAPPHAAVKLWCTSAHRELDLYLDPTGATAVVAATRGTPGTQVVDEVWLDLPDGKVRGVVSVDRGVGRASLGKNGLLVAGVQHGLAYVDLPKGKVVRIDEPLEKVIHLSEYWADDTSVYAVRAEIVGGQTEEVIAIDVRAALDAPSPQAPAPPK